MRIGCSGITPWVARMLPMAAASALLCASAIAHAGSPLALSDGALDSITSGGFVRGFADAAASGVDVSTITATRTFFSGAPGDTYPAAGSESGQVSAVAVGMGTNFGSRTAPPASQATAVTTDGRTGGNFTITSNINYTVTAPNIQVQVGLTSVFGAIIPGW